MELSREGSGCVGLELNANAFSGSADSEIENRYSDVRGHNPWVPEGMTMETQSDYLPHVNRNFYVPLSSDCRIRCMSAKTILAIAAVLCAVASFVVAQAALVPVAVIFCAVAILVP